jgi:hypothetical protein
VILFPNRTQWLSKDKILGYIVLTEKIHDDLFVKILGVNCFHFHFDDTTAYLIGKEEGVGCVFLGLFFF